MKPNSDAIASPAPAAEFDREITDMASYIHNYKVTSELAVCPQSLQRHVQDRQTDYCFCV